MHPVYLQKDPLFNKLPGRIGAYIHRRQGHLTCVDVGANIGDTIAAFFQSENDTFLAIEPNSKFYNILIENWGGNNNIIALPVICSSDNGEASFSIDERKGTASIIREGGGSKRSFKSLDKVVNDYPFASRVNVIKVDTDGHDFQVVEGAQGLLSRQLPCVLFECDAFENTNYTEDCLKILSLFKRAGYNEFLVYNNAGYLMGRYSLSDLAAFRNLLFFQLISRCHHFDLLVMKDAHLAEFYRGEIEFFSSRMPKQSLRRTAIASSVD